MSIENDSSRLVIPDNNEGPSMPFGEHLRELRWLTFAGVVAIFVVVPLTYLFWPLCVRFLELIYPLGKTGSTVAQLRAFQLSGAVDLGTYVAMPAFAIGFLIFALPALHVTERRLALIGFAVGFILYYAVPPLAIWVISTEFLPVVKSVLAKAGIPIVADAQAANRTLVIIVLVLVLLVGTLLVLYLKHRLAAGPSTLRLVTISLFTTPVAILPMWLLVMIFVYIPIAVYLLTWFMRYIDNMLSRVYSTLTDPDQFSERISEIREELRSRWTASQVRRREGRSGAPGRR